MIRVLLSVYGFRADYRAGYQLPKAQALWNRLTETLRRRFALASRLDARMTAKHRSLAVGSAEPDAAIAMPPRGRVLSVDVFRGATIAGMILVNNPGSWTAGYRQLQHAPWHSCTPTDLIFPFFLFIVGMAITLSLTDRVARGSGRHRVYRQIARRSLILLALGIFLTNFPHFHLASLRIPGVLQRIGLCYCAAACITIWARTRGQALVAVALLAVYWLLMTLVPVPGYGAGILEPDGNLAGYVDQLLLPGHTLGADCDPEGLLSTMPAIATTLFGVLAGTWLRSNRTSGEKLVGFAVAGTIGVILGKIMDGWFPINKSLWTSSYVVFTGGMALLCFAVCYVVIDLMGHRRLVTPFIVFGANPIVVYVLSSLVGRLFELYQVSRPGQPSVPLRAYLHATFFAPWAGAAGGSLLYAVAFVFIWLLPMTILYRRRIFIRI